MKEAHRPSPSPFGRNEPRRADYTAHPMHTRTPLALQLYDSLWERYQRGSLEFQSGVDRIVKNSETIVGGGRTVITTILITSPSGTSH